jgi:hypothetical protein
MTTLTVTNASFTHITVEATSPFGWAIMKLPLSLDEFKEGIAKWDAGEYVQDAFKTLNAVQREFLMTGMNETKRAVAFAGDPEDN